MVSQTSLLLQLLALIDTLPLAPSAARRGRPCQYSERLFLKAVVVMVVRHLPSVHALVAVLEQPEMAAVRAALGEHGRFPTRRTFERRLARVPSRLPEQIARVGEHLPCWPCSIRGRRAGERWPSIARHCTRVGGGVA